MIEFLPVPFAHLRKSQLMPALSRLVLSLVAISFLTPMIEADEIRFNRDVRPIFSAHCYHCHGPDESHLEADLRLDKLDGIQSTFEGGLKSDGWLRIISDDADEKMPPPDAHKELKPEQIAVLRKWIDSGSKWEGHWSFVTPSKESLPEYQASDWIRNPIDGYVLEELQRHGLSPSSEADKERLLRRVTFDLTGLPPTIAEMDAFLADDSPGAYEKVVDRLLASPQYGERMTVNWMDAARYGDTSVFHADGPRDMWPWRDWVINAYNSNKPFDEFTIEQLAGDLLPDATTEQKVATGFLRNNATTDEGGAIAEEYRVEYAIDRVKTTSMIWLGLSVECAQCHNHKYDPITQEEYYQFFAYFNQAADPGMQSRNGNQTPVVDIYDDENIKQADALKESVAAVRQQLTEHEKSVEEPLKKWIETARVEAAEDKSIHVPEDQSVYFPLNETKGREVANSIADSPKGSLKGPEKWSTEGKFAGAFQCDGANFIDCGQVADFERTQSFSYGCWVKPDGAGNGVPIGKMNDGNAFRGFDLYIAGGSVQPHIINSWPGNAIKVRTKNKVKPNEWNHVFVTYDGSSKASGVTVYINGVAEEWDIEQDGLSASIRSKVPLYLGRRNPGSAFKGLIDDVRIYSRLLSDVEVSALAEKDAITPILVKADGDWTDAEQAIIRKHYLTTQDDLWLSMTKKIADEEGKIAALTKPVVNVMIMNDVPKMRATYVLNRGNYDSPIKEKELQPGVPSALPPLPEGAEANRLGLAKWLVSGEHPLTARVTVNRYWTMLFGTGIVSSVEDFGSQGEWPTHPDLLDWLAVDFVNHGWDVKRTLKQMVMSATYRQTSRTSIDRLEADPENRLLTRGPRFRLQAEFIRDNALSVSGLLVPEVGGPGVKPYQPPGLWNEVSLSGNVRFVQDKGDKLYRRSMYIYWKRSSPAPGMTTFDCPTRESSVLQRSRTNTPLQALVTMNDTQYIEASRMLAERAMKEGGTTLDEQLTYAYRLATGTKPSARVLSVLKSAVEEEQATFAVDLERATKLLSVGEAKRDEALDASKHAAMTIVCSLILNLDETLTRG